MLRTGCVWTPRSRQDGLRLLVSRFRGRGLPAGRYDVWMANLAPSEPLLRAVLDGEIGWTEYARRYRRELFEPAPVDAGNRTIRNRGQLHSMRLIKYLAGRGHVTLLCQCAEDVAQCHRFLLRDLILSRQV
jgi:uncharacterized protein YeaO (DUF488 family)